MEIKVILNSLDDLSIGLFFDKFFETDEWHSIRKEIIRKFSNIAATEVQEIIVDENVKDKIKMVISEELKNARVRIKEICTKGVLERVKHSLNEVLKLEE